MSILKKLWDFLSDARINGGGWASGETEEKAFLREFTKRVASLGYATCARFMRYYSIKVILVKDNL